MYTSSVEGGKRGGPIKEAIIKQRRIRNSCILIIAICLILLMAALIIYFILVFVVEAMLMWMGAAMRSSLSHWPCDDIIIRQPSPS